LVKEGVSRDEIDRRIAIIRKRLSDPELRRAEINAVWSKNAEAPGNRTFRVSPSGWLVRAVKDLMPGKALDLGMGQGRNALYLAQQGWDVTGVDMSDVAVRQAQSTAADFGVPYTTVVADLQTFDFGREKWDLIASIYEPDWNWVTRIQDGLKVGGLFVRENHPFGPTSARNGLLRSFDSLRVIQYEDYFGPTDYSPEGGTAVQDRVLRLVARKD